MNRKPSTGISGPSTVDSKPSTARRLLLAALGAVLLAAIGLVVYGETRPLKRTFYGSVKDLLPTEAEVPGWKVEYLPIADTPEMQAKVSEILNYDDAVYAVYRKGSDRVSIYMAYWSPGTMSHRLIAGHTPDVCWVNAGWVTISAVSGTDWGGIACRAAKNRNVTDIICKLDAKLRSNVATFDPESGDYRCMSAGAAVEHVLYWHTHGARSELRADRRTFTQAPLGHLSSAFYQKEEQLFIRASFNGVRTAEYNTPNRSAY